MAIRILMPALSPTMTEGNLVRWHKKVGDEVKAGDLLAEVETDKATMEVEAVDEGTIGSILVQSGQQAVPINVPIAILLEEGEGEEALRDILQTAPSSSQERPIDSPVSPPPRKEKVSLPSQIAGRLHASPLARRTASHNQLELQKIVGSGPRGRIIQKDVLEALERPSETFSKNSGPLGDPSFKDQALSSMRKIIAQRLVASKQSIPHFYLSVEVEIDALIAARKDINHKREKRVSLNDMTIQATAKALMANPEMNVAWQGDTLRFFEEVDIAVAVSLKEGLITPLIRRANRKGLLEISTEMKELAGRARVGELRPEEFQGGTFTISNLGMFGVTAFSAILNPPHAGILAIGAGVEKPVVRDGEIAVATCMNLTLSVDHRAVDGTTAAQFLKTLKDFLEQPVRMLL